MKKWRKQKQRNKRQIKTAHCTNCHLTEFNRMVVSLSDTIAISKSWYNNSFQYYEKTKFLSLFVNFLYHHYVFFHGLGQKWNIHLTKPKNDNYNELKAKHTANQIGALFSLSHFGHDISTQKTNHLVERISFGPYRCILSNSTSDIQWKQLQNWASDMYAHITSCD